ncbi:hypothetical protein, partial [Pseudomonas savastanoi]
QYKVRLEVGLIFHCQRRRLEGKRQPSRRLFAINEPTSTIIASPAIFQKNKMLLEMKRSRQLALHYSICKAGAPSKALCSLA